MDAPCQLPYEGHRPRKSSSCRQIQERIVPNQQHVGLVKIPLHRQKSDSLCRNLLPSVVSPSAWPLTVTVEGGKKANKQMLQNNGRNLETNCCTWRNISRPRSFADATKRLVFGLLRWHGGNKSIPIPTNAPSNFQG